MAMTQHQPELHHFQSDVITLVLGYKNTAQGELLPVMQQRAKQALRIAQQFNTPILCTGGWGEKFNQHPCAHASHVQRWMQQQGAPATQFLPYAASRNTYEDGKLCAQAIRLFNVKKVYLVTSDFHIQRGFLWLRHFSPHIDIICKPSETVITEPSRNTLYAHERQAIAQFYRDFPDTPAVETLYDWSSLGLPVS